MLWVWVGGGWYVLVVDGVVCGGLWKGVGVLLCLLGIDVWWWVGG